MTIPDIDCPAHLRARGFDLAPETLADAAAMRALYACQRLPEFSNLSMPEVSKQMLVDSQFDMQRQSYRMQYPDARFLAFTKDGEIIGRLYLASEGADVNLLDILIAEDWRAQGLGAALLEALKSAAFARGQSVLLHVEKTSRAGALYQRLGFRVTGDAQMSWAMRARAG